MNRLEQTKKLMRTQRNINNQIFFFEFPVGQNKIIKKEVVIKSIHGFSFIFFDNIVIHQGVKYKFGQREFDMLYFISAKYGEVVPGPEIFDTVWGKSRKYKQGAVSDVINRIKKRMGAVVLLQYGRGYYLNLNYGRSVEEKGLRVA